jgi:hypothetical protein
VLRGQCNDSPTVVNIKAQNREDKKDKKKVEEKGDNNALDVRGLNTFMVT